MFIEDLRSFSQVPVDNSLELSEGATVPIVGGADNAIYFTQHQFGVGIRFPISSLVKYFLHFTREPPTLIHPNVFWIMMGCSVLKFLYQLDILLVEICFIYTLKLGVGGRLSMSAHNVAPPYPTRPDLEAEPDPGTRIGFTIYTCLNTIEIHVA